VLPRPKVELLPTFYLPDAAGATTAVTDSSPLLRRFEAEFAGPPVRPADPVRAFFDSLLEDYADEWLTKAMFQNPGTTRPISPKPAISCRAGAHYLIPMAKWQPVRQSLETTAITSFIDRAACVAGGGFGCGDSEGRGRAAQTGVVTRLSPGSWSADRL